MSLAALEWAWSLTVSPTQKLVALALADHANDDRECWPSLSRLAARTGLSPSAIKDAMNALEQANLVIRDRDSGRKTRYRLGINGHQTRPPGGPSTRPPGGLGRETARPPGGSTRPPGGPTRPPGGPELGRLAATNLKRNRKEASLTESSPRARKFDAPEAQPKNGEKLSLWDLPHEWREWVVEERPTLNPERMWPIFRDHYRAAVGNKALSADWFGMWRNWVRRERGTDNDRTTNTTAVVGCDPCPDYAKDATPLADIPWMHWH